MRTSMTFIMNLAGRYSNALAVKKIIVDLEAREVARVSVDLLDQTQTGLVVAPIGIGPTVALNCSAAQPGNNPIRESAGDERRQCRTAALDAVRRDVAAPHGPIAVDRFLDLAADTENPLADERPGPVGCGNRIRPTCRHGPVKRTGQNERNFVL